MIQDEHDDLSGTKRILMYGTTTSSTVLPIILSDDGKLDFVPYTGATKDVDLGSFDLTTIGHISSNTATFSQTEGEEWRFTNSYTHDGIDYPVFQADSTSGNLGVGIIDSALFLLSVDGSINPYIYLVDKDIRTNSGAIFWTPDGLRFETYGTGNIIFDPLVGQKVQIGDNDALGNRDLYIYGGYEITQSAIIGKGLTVGAVNEGLTLKGYSGPPPFFQSRGGFINWRKDRTNTAGYSFANNNNEWVLSGSAQNDKVDQGVFAVDMDNGNTVIGGTLSAQASNLGDGGTTNYAEIKADGEINLHGTARVEKCHWIGANGIKAPGAKPATFVEDGLTGCWEFADAIEANQESVSGTVKIPCDMDRTIAPKFGIGWHANGVSPGNCKWQFEYLWSSPNEDVTATAQETLTIVSTASATSNGLVVAEITGIDLPSDTDSAMFWRITRLSGDAQDTIAAVTHMRGNYFKYTSDKLGVAT